MSDTTKPAAAKPAAAKSAATTTTPATPTKPARVEPDVVAGALPEGFTVPEPTRGGGSASKYPIDSLEVGAVFGVKNKTKRDMATLIARANGKYSVRAVDPATGKNKVISTEREFYAVDVDANMAAALKGTAFEGATVLVKRHK